MAGTVEFGFEYRNKRFQDAEKGLRALARSLELGMQATGPAIAREMRAFLEITATALAKRHGNPWPGGTSARTLSRRSGRAIASIRDGVRVTGSRLGEIEGSIGGAFYLRTHEYGATITPKKAKWLTIPLPAALNPDGTPIKQSARQWKNTFVKQTEHGNFLIYQQRGAQIVPLYALKKKVKIPPRLGARETMKAGLPYFVDKAFDAMLRELTKGLA
jgi:hypothetical protein